ncbi:MAG: HesA/MoeB/ThiF family protein [Bacteroidales bacterium]|jgi:adenylyltransferase/sulfurtransferase|nr:HesA/MoeB/ThiF family protein [Bacteroidales bacterium]MCU0408607.1 HesA/MoeB/ThiF family protein [Bacteroidales bacterium]
MESPYLSQRERRRYGRQIMLPGIGIEGQEKIRNSSVLVVGAGGLGCPVLQYLTAAGTGRIGIVEFDTVDETNLQRQILYGSSDLGKLKSVIAKQRLEEIALLSKIEVFNIRLDSSNSGRICSSFDIIVDATDNFEARYAIDDACSASGKPMVHGSIYRSEGSVSVFNYKGGPGYRDYNPQKDRGSSRNPSPGETGLFGVLPGITGTIMANEAIKIITGTGSVLSGMILVFNIHDNTFITYKLKTHNEITTDKQFNKSR